jgi:N-methylhydantoinase B
VLVKGSNAYDLMAQGRVPTFQDIEGETVPREKTFGATHMKLDDVLLSTGPAAGGWGDPLDRPVEDVQSDIDFGVVTPDAAQILYGAVLDENERVDAAATHTRRAQLRAERKAWPTQRTLSVAPAADTLTRVGPMGDQLEIVRDGDGGHWTRCTCGQVLAPARENWREYSGRDIAEPSEISPLIWVNDAMEVRRYSCPGCGRIHAVDLCRKGAPDPHDIQVAL